MDKETRGQIARLEHKLRRAEAVVVTTPAAGLQRVQRVGLVVVVAARHRVVQQAQGQRGKDRPVVLVTQHRETGVVVVVGQARQAARLRVQRPAARVVMVRHLRSRGQRSYTRLVEAVKAQRRVGQADQVAAEGSAELGVLRGMDQPKGRAEVEETQLPEQARMAS